jgi:hypothetical protein
VKCLTFSSSFFVGMLIVNLLNPATPLLDSSINVTTYVTPRFFGFFLKTAHPHAAEGEGHRRITAWVLSLRLCFVVI